MHRPRRRPWNGPLFLLALVLAGCAAGQAVSDGDEARARGAPFAAATHYLDALDEDPDHEEALKKLRAVAEPAYTKQLRRARERRRDGELEAALRAYGDLRTYLRRLREHGALAFTPVPVPERIRAVNRDIAGRHYTRAEALFREGRYEQAIRQYERALEHRAPFREAGRQIAASYYRMATEAYAAHRYRHAAETYRRALQERAHYRDARRRAAALYYHLGTHFLAEGHCRKAYEDFGEALSVRSGFRDANEKRAEARACATIRVAFAELTNTTRRTLAGMNLGSVIFQKTRSRLQQESSRFLDILTRQQLSVLTEEHRMKGGAESPTAGLPRSFEGADYVVFGDLNQVQVHDSGPTTEPRRTSYEYAAQERFVNEDGDPETRTVWREAVADFTLNTVSRTVRIGGSIQVAEVSSREIVVDHTVEQADRDVARYVTNIRADHNLGGENVRLDDRFAELMGADPRLKSVNAMVRPRLDAIARHLTRRIQTTLDRSVRGAAPARLDVTFQGGPDAGR